MPLHSELLVRTCQVQTDALSAAETSTLLAQIEGWQIEDFPAHPRIAKRFDFRNYYETLAFINAIAYMVHAENHHPALVVTYNCCIVKFDTHSVNNGTGGLSINDFICAAKVDAIFQQTAL